MRLFKRVLYLVITVTWILPSKGCNYEDPFVVENLTTEYLSNPLGLDVRSPKLSWKISGKGYGLRQTAYQILVAADPENLTLSSAGCWNTGKVRSNQSVHIPYEGEPLESGEKYYWKVRIWDHNNQVSEFSEVNWWQMGLVDDGDWKGEWISAVENYDSVPPLLPAPYFRKEFILPDTIVSAHLYISGLGYYEAFLNGEKIGNHVLDPVKTRYDKRVKYSTYDVTDQISAGYNAIGVVLGNGWYNQHTREAWDFDQAPWRDSPSLICQLEVKTGNGNKIIIKSDNSWNFSTGPLVFDGIHNGETYDARLELGEWSKPDYNDREWKPAVTVAGPRGKLSSQIMPPIRIINSIKPEDKWDIGDSVKMFDLGQNITGWAFIKVRGPEGSQVTLRYGERIYEDGTLDQEELSRFIWTGDTQTSRYILKGDGIEEGHQVFVYHGFKYIEVHLSDPELELIEIEGHVVHTDLDENGYFECSHELFNQIHQNLLWSYLGNYHGYPTDCPHREKMGWTGDALLVAETGLFNFDAVRAYLKWIDDFTDEQRPNGQLPGIVPTSGWGYTYGRGENRERGYGPQWEGAFMEIPWQMYRYTGDTSIIEKYYPRFKKYVNYLTVHSENHLLDFGIDDHKQLDNLTHGDYLSSAFYFRFAGMLADMAHITDRFDDHRKYSELASEIKKSFNEKYYDREKRIYLHGGQTPMALALYFGLTEDMEEYMVLEGLLKAIELKQGHIDAGVVGTKAVINSLLMYEEYRTLFELADKRSFPGWGYWIEELGATTLFQNWDGSQSRNHIMFGSIGDYFYKGLAGINIDESNPGFAHFIIKPSLDNDITWVNAGHNSPYGKIESYWEKKEEEIVFEFTIPANSSAELQIPVAESTKIRIERGKNIEYTGFKAGFHIYKAPPGSYRMIADSGDT